MPEQAAGRMADFSELGRSGLKHFGGHVYEEFLPSLSGYKAIRVYQEMSSNDATVGGMLYASEQLLRKAAWRAVPASDSEADKAAAEFLDDCREDMSVSWTDFIGEVLTMMIYGWSFHETVYKRREDGRIGWKNLPGRSQDSLYNWEMAENGDIKAMVQMAPPDYETRTIPLSKGLLFRTKVVKDNPEGWSLLRNAYRSWYFKKRIEEIEGIGVERDLAGLPVLVPPSETDIWNDDDPEAARVRGIANALVKNIRRDENEGIVLPYGWELTLLSTGSRRQFDTNAIVNRYDQRIAVTILADVVLLGAEKVGSYALSEVKKSLYASGLEALLSSVADVLNRYAVPALFALNVFPGITGLPKLVHSEIEAPDLDKLSRLITAMYNTGSRISEDLPTENYLRDIAGMPKVDKPGESTRSQEEPKNNEDIDNEINRLNTLNNPKQTNDGSKGGE